MVERLRRAITPRTRVVGLTWVHSSTGLRLPIRALAEVVKAANAGRDEADRCLLIVDGVHGFGCVDESAASLGCDFFVAGTHKWIFGPRGTGIIWGRAEAWPHTRPTVPSFDSLGPFARWERISRSTRRRGPAGVPGGFYAYEHYFANRGRVPLHEHQAGRIADASRSSTVLPHRAGGMKHVTPTRPWRGAGAGIVCFGSGLTPRSGRAPEGAPHRGLDLAYAGRLRACAQDHGVLRGGRDGPSGDSRAFGLNGVPRGPREPPPIGRCPAAVGE
jgi:hypothetical protein